MPAINTFLDKKKSEEGQSKSLFVKGLVPYVESDEDGSFSSE